MCSYCYLFRLWKAETLVKCSKFLCSLPCPAMFNSLARTQRTSIAMVSPESSEYQQALKRDGKQNEEHCSMPVSEGCCVDDGAILFFKIIFYEKKKPQHTSFGSTVFSISNTFTLQVLIQTHISRLTMQLPALHPWLDKVFSVCPEWQCSKHLTTL